MEKSLCQCLLIHPRKIHGLGVYSISECRPLSQFLLCDEKWLRLAIEKKTLGINSHIMLFYKVTKIKVIFHNTKINVLVFMHMLVIIICIKI